MVGSVSLVRAGSVVAPLLWARRGVECCSQSLFPQCLSQGAPPTPSCGRVPAPRVCTKTRWLWFDSLWWVRRHQLVV